jgi:hypothetical protein
MRGVCTDGERGHVLLLGPHAERDEWGSRPAEPMAEHVDERRHQEVPLEDEGAASVQVIAQERRILLEGDQRRDDGSERVKRGADRRSNRMTDRIMEFGALGESQRCKVSAEDVSMGVRDQAKRKLNPRGGG